MQVIEAYDNLMTRIGQIREQRDNLKKNKTPLDNMEAAALTNILLELYAVAADLESTEEVNPPWGTRPDKGTFTLGK